jgi:small-conductance mechanosensitive channel
MSNEPNKHKRHQRIITYSLIILMGIIIASIIATHPPIIKALRVGLIVLSGWILIKVVDTIVENTLEKFRGKKGDNLKERKIRTQIVYIRGILYVVIVILTISIIFMQYEALANFGKGLLASAGLATVALAFAAQKSLGTLLAGFQVAFTQPIRVEDVVIVENEWGTIEEITLTYVVVKIWDDRRLVLPITYFTDTPFQNWTRNSSHITGTVVWHLDHTADIDAMRKQLTKILKFNDNWDKRFANIQVTDTTDKTITVRSLVTAKDAPTAWNLRCEVREAMLSFIQKKHPNWLPRFRVDEKEVE